MNNRFTANIGGQLKVIGIWPEGVNSHDSDGKEHGGYAVMRGATDVLERMERQVANVNANGKLSSKGEREARQDVHAEALSELAKLAKRADEVTAKTEKHQQGLMTEALGPRDKSDAYNAAVDVAIAQRLREMDELELSQALQGDKLDSQSLYVLGTLPPLLTGASAEHVERARKNAVFASSPEDAVKLQSAGEVNEAMQRAMGKAYSLAAQPLDKAGRIAAIGNTQYHRLDSTASPAMGSLSGDSEAA